MGTAKSGMYGHIRGWHLGVRVTMDIDEDGKDTCTVILTGGSSNPMKGKTLGIFTEGDLE